MSIQRRSIFYDNTGGIVRMWDWALVTTTLGTMAEPFSPNARHTIGNEFPEFDPADEINRIDEIRATPIDVSLLVLSGGETQIHGGAQLPRGNSR
jgi:hypothetical protein